MTVYTAYGYNAEGKRICKVVDYGPITDLVFDKATRLASDAGYEITEWEYQGRRYPAEPAPNTSTTHPRN